MTIIQLLMSFDEERNMPWHRGYAYQKAVELYQEGEISNQTLSEIKFFLYPNRI